MGEVHPFTVRIEADPLSALRFRWTVCEGNQIHIRSPHSYATRREADREANEVIYWLRVFLFLAKENQREGYGFEEMQC
jgi:hypothetical protein